MTLRLTPENDPLETLTDRVAVVTGGGTGIGAGIAHALAGEGCQVIILGRRMATLERVIAQSKQAGHRHPIFASELDVSDREAVLAQFARLQQQFKKIDLLVNCAGMNILRRSMADMAPDQWDEVLRVNATGAYNCLMAVLPEMRQRQGGMIINISSIAGKRALTLAGVAYAASKFAMTALGTAVANEVRTDGVRVTNVYPGEVNTPILDHRPKPVSEEHRAAILQPEDVAALVVTIAKLPPRAHVPEVVIKPTFQEWL
jgi:NADP-dependent 3-hydroxy acid dehydrogenase YdfG